MQAGKHVINICYDSAKGDMVPRLPEGMKNLNAIIPRELHKRVKDEAYARNLSIDRCIEGILNEHFRRELSGAIGYTVEVNQQFNPAELPEQFLRDALKVYSISLDEFAALQRVTAAVARGQESIRASSVDRARFGSLQPLPVERKADDDDGNDKPG